MHGQAADANGKNQIAAGKVWMIHKDLLPCDLAQARHVGNIRPKCHARMADR